VGELKAKNAHATINFLQKYCITNKIKRLFMNIPSNWIEKIKVERKERERARDRDRYK
jgi:hypothetical protein